MLFLIRARISSYIACFHGSESRASETLASSLLAMKTRGLTTPAFPRVIIGWSFWTGRREEKGYEEGSDGIRAEEDEV